VDRTSFDRKENAMRRHVALCLVMVLVVVGEVGLAGSAEAGDNSESAKACQRGGWATFVRADGSGFANVGDCVRYAAHGGTLRPHPDPKVTIVRVAYDGVYLFVDFVATGFAPNSPLAQYSYAIGDAYFDFTEAEEYPPGHFATDAHGTFDSGFAIGPGTNPVECVEGTPGSVTVIDGDGNTATGDFVVTCS
jgi:hypothetical protein